MEAGKELAAYIAALKLPPSDRLFLVTHSHGGNVALYALSHPGTERVEGIVFLATPISSIPTARVCTFVGMRDVALRHSNRDYLRSSHHSFTALAGVALKPYFLASASSGQMAGRYSLLWG